MKEIFLDVTDEKGRFICQVPFRYHPDLPFRYKDVFEAVYARRPSLRKRKINIGFSHQKVL